MFDKSQCETNNDNNNNNNNNNNNRLLVYVGYVRRFALSDRHCPTYVFNGFCLS